MKESKIKTLLTIAVPLLILIAVVVIITRPKYSESWIIGRTEAEITERYGAFDRVQYNIYGQLSSGYYVTKESHVGFLGTYPEEYLGIDFKDGVACECFELEGWYGG